MDTNADVSIPATPVDSDLQKSFTAEAPGINPVMNWTVSLGKKEGKKNSSLNPMNFK